jgi:hypothetical protein
MGIVIWQAKRTLEIIFKTKVETGIAGIGVSVCFIFVPAEVHTLILRAVCYNLIRGAGTAAPIELCTCRKHGFPANPV